MYYDSHCHLDDSIYDRDRALVIERARSSGVTQLLLAGVEPEGWLKQRLLMQTYSGFTRSVGIHPCLVDRFDEDGWNVHMADLVQQFEEPQPPVAVGEIGLHKSRNFPLEKQIDRFSAQVKLAKMLQKPMILHIVGAHGAALDLLRRIGPFVYGGVVHSFSGSSEVAQAYVELNLRLGVTARWCKGGGKKLAKALKSVELEHLLLESDAPDQSAVPGHRNEPTAIIDAAQWVAVQKGLTREAVLVQCSKNAQRLFSVT